ncbi:DUF5672 family protein [Eisenibacter elegans]|uniref:DUF5672 family protein n=1 Tax=Eisenibacter elegans TaxID=997 RepID=UPI0004050DC9|nr:DUF5672 family protein [Eisenibacter elegans]
MIAPQGLDLTAYLEVAPRLKAVFFDSSFFTSTIAYSKLLLSAFFYQTFAQYQYLLIYQLDAYVFKDELLYWCRQGYDYIGAPWLSPESITKNKLHYFQATYSTVKPIRFIKKRFNFSQGRKIFVGNGGFSLRNVKTHFKVCQSLRHIGIYLDTLEHNEDIIWSIYVPCYFPFYKIPHQEIALQFAFEELPQDAYKLNKDALPFGVHAWEKYDPVFWEMFIQTLS